MKNFIITGKFIGYVEALYDDVKLLKLNFINAQMQAQQWLHFKADIPMLYRLFPNFLLENSLTAVETGYDVPFDEFWDKYKKKVNRARCLPIWQKMTASERVQAVAFVDRYNRVCEREGRGKLDPENYLRRKTWENEY